MAIIGIDPDATHTVERDGATFTIGTIPRGLWLRLRQENHIAVERARRRAIASCAADGIEPEEPFHEWEKDGEKHSISNLLQRTHFDPAYLEEHHSHMKACVRLGLRSWSGVLKPDGSELGLVLETTKHDGDDMQVVSKESLRWIARSPALLESLYLAIAQLNDLQEPEKKA